MIIAALITRNAIYRHKNLYKYSTTYTLSVNWSSDPISYSWLFSSEWGACDHEVQNSKRTTKIQQNETATVGERGRPCMCLCWYWLSIEFNREFNKRSLQRLISTKIIVIIICVLCAHNFLLGHIWRVWVS